MTTFRSCCAPAAYGFGTTLTCGKDFVPTCDHQLYCSQACATRAHKKQRRENKRARALGLPIPQRGFPESIREAILKGETPKRPSTLGEGAPAHTFTVAPPAIIEEVKRLEQLDAVTSIDETALLRRLGYLPAEDRRGIEPQRRPEPDRSAEPKSSAKVSTEDEPPDFRDHEEPTAPIDYDESDL